MAKEEKEKGKEVKISYMKMCIDGKWFKWNEKEDCVLKEKERRGKQWKKEEEGRVGGGARMCFWNIVGVANKDKEVWKYLSKFEYNRTNGDMDRRGWLEENER